MNIKKQTFVPPSKIRDVGAPAQGMRRLEGKTSGGIDLSLGLVCPGCESRDHVTPLVGRQYPLLCGACGAVGTLVDFGGTPTNRFQSGAFHPINHRKGR